MTESIIVAIITGTLSLVGVIISSFFTHSRMMAEVQKQQAVTDEKIETLTREVREHNEVIKRTYALEARADVVDEKLSRLEKGASV